MTILIAIALIAMLVIFFSVTIAGGKAHDRQNAETARRAERSAAEARAADPETRSGE